MSEDPQVELSRHAPAVIPSTPVWAPTPGVPIIARLLAYAFAALMLVAMALSFLAKRPQNLPFPPQKWEYYHSEQGSIVPYPASWHLVHQTKKGNDQPDVVRVLFPDGWDENNTDIIILSYTLPQQGNTEIDSSKVLDRLESLRQTRFSSDNYVISATDASVAPNNLHSFTLTGKHQQIKSGNWLLLLKDNHFTYIESVTPVDGKQVMDTIVTQMGAATTM